jgi:hypothetical protein
MQLMNTNCWILQADFIDRQVKSLSDLPSFNSDGDESNMVLSDNDSSPKGEISLTAH